MTLSSSLKIVGICYGHQLVGLAYNAKVEKRPRFGGMESIIFNKEVLEEYLFLLPLRGRKLNLLVEHH